jgi:hypothetical protein
MRLWAAALVLGLAAGCEAKEADVKPPDVSFKVPAGRATASAAAAPPKPDAPSPLAAVLPTMGDLEKQVAADSVAQYETAKAVGDAMTMCTYAGMVVAAFIQAKDAEKAKAWKAIEKSDCAKAGVPSL